MPASGKLIADFNPARAAGEKLTSFLRERVFSKNTTIHASVPLSKRLIFVKEPGTNKPREELNATAAEMERTALKAVINLVEVSQLVDLPQLLEHRVVEGCMVLFNSDVHIQEDANEVLSTICILAGTLRRSRRHGHDLEDGNSNSRRSADARWHPIQVVGLCAHGITHHPCRHGDAYHIICVNDPYDAAYSTKDGE